jgi:hypothetical protein
VSQVITNMNVINFLMGAHKSPDVFEGFSVGTTCPQFQGGTEARQFYDLENQDTKFVEAQGNGR